MNEQVLQRAAGTKNVKEECFGHCDLRKIKQSQKKVKSARDEKM